jgi:hypothetical protein
MMRVLLKSTGFAVALQYKRMKYYESWPPKVVLLLPAPLCSLTRRQDATIQARLLSQKPTDYLLFEAHLRHELEYPSWMRPH